MVKSMKTLIPPATQRNVASWIGTNFDYRLRIDLNARSISAIWYIIAVQKVSLRNYLKRQMN